MTSKQFSELNNKLKNEKEKVTESLIELLDKIKNDKLDTEVLNSVHSVGINFFIEFENFITSSSSEYEQLSKVQIEDILTSIENILKYSIEYWDIIRNASSILNIKLEPQNNFLYTSQVVLKTYRKNTAKEIRKKFESNSIPIKGFIAKEKLKLTIPKLDLTSLIIGVIFLSITAYIAFIINISTGTQYWITRIFGSLGTALVITAFSKHFIQAKINIPSYAITATGAIAIFLILYLVNPANEPQYNVNNNATNIVNNGNNNTVIINKNLAQDFYNPLRIEKELNMQLLISLSTNKDSNYLQQLAYNPKYLNTNFIDSFNIYQNIKDKQMLSYLIELKPLLKKINNNIEKLHNANMRILSGDLQSIQQAIFDFVYVSDKAKRTIELYQLIEKTHNKSLERNI